MQGYRDHINMPDFVDYHFGFAWAPTAGFRADYMGSLSSDDFAVVVPRQTNILSRINPNIGDPTATVVPDYKNPRKETPRSKKLSLDSISAVIIDNQAHFLALAWDAGPDHLVENDFGFQAQRWRVDFKAGSSDGLALSQSAAYYNYRLADTWTPSENHAFKLGLSYDFKKQSFDMNLPYVLYDVIVNSNMDMLEPLGYFSDKEFSIVKRDSSRNNFDYLGELPARIHFTHRGAIGDHYGGLFAFHTIKLPSGSFSYGARGEYQNTSREFFAAPRLDCRWNMNERNDLIFTAGLYSQNDLPFYQRDRNPYLRSEKSAQTGLQWTRRLGRGYRVVLDGYYKRYYDLVAASLEPDNTIDLKGFLVPLPDTRLSPAEVAELESVLDTTRNFSTLPDSIQQSSYETFGGLIFQYANTGTGNCAGTELSFFYEPTAAWSGWMSADLSLSNRSDGPGRPYYDYRYHRPLVFNWVNYFDIPGNFDVSFTYRWALGQPYTPYSGVMDGRGSFDPIAVGARDSGRLAPYSRLDMRLSHHAHWWKRDFKTYLEIWNSMNSPNYFARDESTGQLKSAQLNWPFPLFFLGISADL
jgi:hypothetical protein